MQAYHPTSLAPNPTHPLTHSLQAQNVHGHLQGDLVAVAPHLPATHTHTHTSEVKHWPARWVELAGRSWARAHARVPRLSH